MTWRAICPDCSGYGFDMTWGSRENLYVNCSDPECGALILEIEMDKVVGITVNRPAIEPH
jgi:hypothetical protein